MGVIFYFSSKPADVSGESSLTIANSILNIYENVSDTQFQIDDRTEKLYFIDHVVRKGAHFMEYAILACAIAFHFFVWKRKRIWWLLVPVIFVALYASSDELHQTMVQGRSGEVRDVVLDTLGAIAGTLMFNLMIDFKSYIIAKKRFRS